MLWRDTYEKLLAIILTCIMFIASLGYVSATYLGDGVFPEFSVEFNGDATELTSIIHRDMHYVPLRAIFEKFGATVYYRERNLKLPMILTIHSLCLRMACMIFQVLPTTVNQAG